MGLCASSPAPPGAVPASNGSVPEAGAKASPRASLQKDESLAAKPVAGEEAPPGGAGPPASASASDRTRVVLRWRRGPCIGRGGSGAVFVARQPDTGALFAVKEVDLSKQSADAIKDIRTEINTLRRLTHPNIVQYLGSQMRGSTLCILMEWVPGGSARQFLRDMGELPPGVIARYAVQALRGLGWLHSRNVIHCDVKPDNLLLDDNGTVLLADFGAASMRVALGSPVDASQGGGRRVQGSPYYMSPETMRGDAPTPAADIWGLGATVLELATGRPPWSDRGIRDAPSLFVHVTKDASRLPTIPERLPASLRDFLSQCFRRDPSSRPSAVALLAHPFVASTSARVPVARMASRMASVLPDLGEGPQGSAATGTSGARPGGGHRLAASLSLAVVAEFSQPPSAAPGRANDSLAPQSGAGSAGGTDSSALRRILMRAQSNACGPGIDGPAAQPAGGFARGSSVMRGSLGYGRMMSRVDSVGMAQALGGGAGGSGQPTSTFLAFDSRMRSVMVGDELAGHTGSGSRGRSSGDPAAQGTQSRKGEEPLFVDASGALLAGTVDDTLPDVDWEMEGDDAPELGVAAQRGGGAPRLSPAGAGRASAKPGRSRSSGSVPGPRVDTGRRSRLAQSGSTDVAPGAAGTAARGGAFLRQFGSAMGQSATGSVSTADGAASLDGVALASNSQSSPALAGRSGRAGSTSGSDNPRAAGETADAPAPKSSPMLITGAASRSAAARSMRRGRSRASGDGSRSREVANDDEEDEDETTSEDDSEREDRPDEEWAAEARSRRDLVGVSKDEEAAAQALGDRDPRASTVFNLDDIMEDGAGGSADEADARDPALESGATEMGSRLDAPFVSGISGSQTTRHDASSPRIADGGSPLATPRVAAPGHWASSSASKMAKDSKPPSSSSSEFHLAVTAGQASGLGSSLRLSTSTNGDGQRRSGGGTSASPASHLGEGDTLGSRRAAPFGPSPALPHMAMMRSGSVHARPQLDAVPESRSKPVAVQQLGDVRSRSAKAVFRNAPDEVAEAALRGYMQARAKNVLAVAFGQGWTDDGNPVLYDNSELLRKFAAEADGGEAASAAVPPRPS
ncbi:hypothetical protein FNF31_03112 [Cafeteria roenbergensis]|uniref:Protein kinase domain-containing protein n=1 Tax=Cafeteria roenbergensis TaxID=33653 RepID=A0A5A8DWR5_CAFRO|nr:hypothetical protein FNF31_03112 [Cafeteria roenbergensis]KAA0169678.1 hypothetical protein FNF28_01956 [Cafeteria roenbergensis]